MKKGLLLIGVLSTVVFIIYKTRKKNKKSTSSEQIFIL